VGVGGELACYAGAPFAAALRGRRVRDVGLLSARWRQRRVRRRLRRLAGSALEFGDARQQRLVLLDEIVDLRQQGQHQPLQAVGVKRIDPLGPHPELESNGSDALNAAALSHSAAGVSSYKVLQISYVLDVALYLPVKFSLELCQRLHFLFAFK